MEQGFKTNSFKDLAEYTGRGGTSHNTEVSRSDQKKKPKPDGPRNAARVKSLTNESLEDLIDDINSYLATKGVYALSQPIFTSSLGSKTLFHAVLRFSGKIDQFQKEPWQLSTDYRFAEFYQENGFQLSEAARRWEYLMEHYEGDNVMDLEVDFPDSLCRHHAKYGRYDDVKPTDY